MFKKSRNKTEKQSQILDNRTFRKIEPFLKINHSVKSNVLANRPFLKTKLSTKSNILQNQTSKSEKRKAKIENRKSKIENRIDKLEKVKSQKFPKSKVPRADF